MPNLERAKGKMGGKKYAPTKKKAKDANKRKSHVKSKSSLQMTKFD